MNAVHELLVEAPHGRAAGEKALRFLAGNLLARYEETRIIAEATISAADPQFQERLAAGMAENRQRAAALLTELQEAGVTTLDRLRELPQGYESKLLHTLAHLLDGFFGIDTYFYNLADDSHEVPEQRHRLIRQAPEKYWLLRAAARTGPGGGEPLAKLRHRAANP